VHVDGTIRPTLKEGSNAHGVSRRVRVGLRNNRSKCVYFRQSRGYSLVASAGGSNDQSGIARWVWWLLLACMSSNGHQSRFDDRGIEKSRDGRRISFN
jgi:hypothetical protein